MYAKCFKRIIDFSLSLIALIILSPLLVVLMILGTVFMRGNPFFIQKRRHLIAVFAGQHRTGGIHQQPARAHQARTGVQYAGLHLFQRLRVRQRGSEIHALALHAVEDIVGGAVQDPARADNPVAFPRPHEGWQKRNPAAARRRKHKAYPGVLRFPRELDSASAD